MAANCGRRTLQFSAKTILSRSSSSSSSSSSPFASKATKLSGLASPNKTTSASLFSAHKLRLPLELGGALSLMPFHSVTASALSTSLLSLSNTNWGCLSEGFATPL